MADAFVDVFGGVAPAPAPPELEREPAASRGRSLGWVSDRIAGLVEGGTPRWWWWAFVPALGVTAAGGGLAVYLMSTGVGVWGVMVPVAWAWDITNFVFWIGIGHAGTLISAILFLLRQEWRTPIHRVAEAMTLFAVICAAVFPLIHMGRLWLAWWLLPLPNANGIWPQFQSPLMWDVFAVSTYFVVSLLFWYVGLIPDLATLRDRAATRGRRILYGLGALGWTGSARHWRHYAATYLLLAGLSTPLVLSVHSVVSFDFAVSQVPGWHTTLFPPYFVAGAVFSGLGMVLTLVIPLRAVCGLEEVVGVGHIERMCKLTLAACLMVAYAQGAELCAAWYGGSEYDLYAFKNRAFGPYAWAYWTMVGCALVAPQLFWFKRVRTRMAAVFMVSILINVGMWLERFVIIVTPLHRDYLPANWAYFQPTWVDVGQAVGACGLFLTLFLLFLRFLPMIAIAEIKALTPHARPSPMNPAHGGQP
ncbi:MAG: polysulfide reductase NrfD [Verrucomicrobia bacterium]|nr:polysulfide reductase NrfD [Verrucomicrobiota bacterium]